MSSCVHVCVLFVHFVMQVQVVHMFVDVSMNRKVFDLVDQD
jgi:hypothetical protein